MAVTRSISIDGSLTEFPANWDEGATVNQQSFKVKIDGKTTGGGFRYEVSESDWFDVLVTDNTFTVTVKENFNINDRNGYITIHHNCIQGDDGEKTVDINQKGIDCQITASSENITFTSDNYDADERNITVTVTGGNKKYFIKEFKKFNENDKLIKNDNGIKVKKISDELLRVTSYGRTFLENGQYYKIVLAHDNDATKTETIEVKYNDINVKNEVPVSNTTVVATASLRSAALNTISSLSIPTFEEKLEAETEVVTPSLSIYGLNTPIITTTKSKKLKAAKLSDEIVFDHEGGTKEYKMEVVPEKSLVSVKISSDFVSYKISGGVLTLTAKYNPYTVDRKCLIKIKNIYDPVNTIVKTIVQKGVDQ